MRFGSLSQICLGVGHDWNKCCIMRPRGDNFVVGTLRFVCLDLLASERIAEGAQCAFGQVAPRGDVQNNIVWPEAIGNGLEVYNCSCCSRSVCAVAGPAPTRRLTQQKSRRFGRNVLAQDSITPPHQEPIQW